jgi:hypothetical protein
MIFLMITVVLFPGFKIASFNEFCLENGIDQQFLVLRVPQYNRVVE